MTQPPPDFARPLACEADLPHSHISAKKWAKIIDEPGDLPFSDEERANLQEFKLYLESTSSPDFGFNDQDLLHFLRKLKPGKRQFETTRNRLLTSNQFMRSFDYDSITIWDVEDGIRNDFTLISSDRADIVGRPVFAARASPTFVPNQENIMDVLRITLYFMKVYHELHASTGKHPVIISDLESIPMTSVDVRLKKTMSRIFTDVFPLTAHTIFCTHSPIWIRFIMRIMTPFIPAEFVLVADKVSEITDIVIPRIAQPAPIGDGPTVDQWIAWRKTLEPRPERPHHVSAAVLRSWNIKVSQPAGVLVAERKGWCWKRTRTGRWTKYYMVLDDGILFYYKKKSSTVANNGIMLEETALLAGDEASTVYSELGVRRHPLSRCLILSAPVRPYVFAFPEQEAEGWAEVLGPAITRRRMEMLPGEARGEIIEEEDHDDG